MTPILSPQSISLWQVSLSNFLSELNELTILLSPDELQRANRFRFTIHRNRFIIARAMLRKILNLYIMTPAQKIIFTLGEHGKPYLNDNPLNVQFNVSHSHDIAVYAITQQYEVGIDIEKIESIYRNDVAKRFFSSQEYSMLETLPFNQQIIAFYHLWARKEAVIKALGKGLYQSTNDFSVDWQQPHEEITVDAKEIYVQGYHLSDTYAVALASLQPIKQINYWEWNTHIS
jgi:4'-phosphopantetheinyl transferase